MIPPRLRAFLVRVFIHDVTATRGPRIGRRSIAWHTGETHTANLSAMDLRLLERKGLIEYERLKHMSEADLAMWGCPWFSVKITEAGKEELADDYASLCAEADEQNAKLENPDPFGDKQAEEVGAESVRVRPRT